MLRALLILATALTTGSLRADDIQILAPWVRAMPPGSEATAAFMEIRNTGSREVTLVSASSGIATHTKPMITTKQTVNGQEVSGMEFVDSFTIAPNSTRKLAPGGDHLMLLKLHSVPAPGEMVKFRLIFETDGKREEKVVDATVR